MKSRRSLIEKGYRKRVKPQQNSVVKLSDQPYPISERVVLFGQRHIEGSQLSVLLTVGIADAFDRSPNQSAPVHAGGLSLKSGPT